MKRFDDDTSADSEEFLSFVRDALPALIEFGSAGEAYVRTWEEFELIRGQCRWWRPKRYVVVHPKPAVLYEGPCGVPVLEIAYADPDKDFWAVINRYEGYQTQHPKDYAVQIDRYNVFERMVEYKGYDCVLLEAPDRDDGESAFVPGISK